MNKKKIIFILPHLNGGGAERVTINYIRSIDRSYFEPILVVFDMTSDLLGIVPQEIKVINTKTIKVSKSYFRLRAVLKKYNPDYVFTSHYTVSSLLWVVKPITSKFIHIARIPGSPKSEKENLYYGSFKRKLFGIGLRSANITIAQTSDMKNEAMEIFRLKSEKCYVMPNPIDKTYVDKVKHTNKELFPQKEFSIVAAGRLHSVKGYDILIKAMTKVLEQKKNAHLHIIGSDKGFKNELVQLALNLKLGEKVTFHGFVNNPYPYYHQSDLFVLSSIHEGFPNALLENYYLNIPMVATKCANIVEALVKDGINGYVCSKNDVNELAEKIILSSHLNKSDINNPEYNSSNLNSLITCIES